MGLRWRFGSRFRFGFGRCREFLIEAPRLDRTQPLDPASFCCSPLSVGPEWVSIQNGGSHCRPSMVHKVFYYRCLCADFVYYIVLVLIESGVDVVPSFADILHPTGCAGKKVYQVFCILLVFVAL